MLTYLYMGIEIAIGISIFFLIFNLLTYWNSKNTFAQSIKQIYEYTKRHEKERQDAYENEYKRDGALETKGLLNKLDKKIAESGIKNRFKNLNAEIALIVTFITSVIVGIIIYIIFGNFILSLAGFIVSAAMFYIFLDVKCSIAFIKEEKNLIIFMDLVYSYSSSTDDLIQILDSAGRHLTEPLRTEIAECCVQARITGDISSAIQTLSMKVGNPKFYEVLSNLEIGSKYQANYAEMVDAMRDDVKIYLKGRQEDKARASGARIMWVILTVCGLFLLKMIKGFGEKSLFSVLFGSAAGYFVVFYFIVVYLIVLIKTIKSFK